MFYTIKTLINNFNISGQSQSVTCYTGVSCSGASFTTSDSPSCCFGTGFSYSDGSSCQACIGKYNFLN